jgi:hypothetical protein
MRQAMGTDHDARRSTLADETFSVQRGAFELAVTP